MPAYEGADRNCGIQSDISHLGIALVILRFRILYILDREAYTSLMRSVPTRSDKLSGLRSSPIFCPTCSEERRGKPYESLVERLYSFFPCILCIVRRACWSYEMYELQSRAIKMLVSRNIRHSSHITRTFL